MKLPFKGESLSEFLDEAWSAVEPAVGVGASEYAWTALVLAAFEEQRPSWLEPWLKQLNPAVLEIASAAVTGRGVRKAFTADEVVRLFEGHLAQLDGGEVSGRKNTGAYFTPPGLADLVVDQTLRPLLAELKSADEVLALRILDPAVGGGTFLLSAGRRVAERLVEVAGTDTDYQSALREVVRRCLFGVDVNPLAVMISTALLARMADDVDAPLGKVLWSDTLLPPSELNLGQTYLLAPPLDLSRWVGVEASTFDVVLGNPPWGAVKPLLRQYVAKLDVSMLHLHGDELRQRLEVDPVRLDGWTSHADAVRSYGRALKESGWYRYQGRGDADLYRYFLERAHQLVRTDGGRLGLLVPAALLRADGAANLRRMFLNTGTFERLNEFINSERVFDIHAMFRFVMLVWRSGESGGVTTARFGVRSVDDARRPNTGVALDLPFLVNVGGGGLTIPEVRTGRDAQLLDKLYGAHRLLGDSSRRAPVRFVRELDMTMDSRRFVRTRPADNGDDLVPLYEGRMVHQFDERAKAYMGGTGRRAVWTAQGTGERPVCPQFWVDSSLAERVGGGAPRPGFCDITGHANERTLLAAMIPGASAAGNKVPTLRIEADDPLTEAHVWLAVANSFVVDWIARRRVSTTLNFFHLEQLPFPEVDPLSREGKQLVELSRALTESTTFWGSGTLSQRAALRAEIDVIVACLYGLDISDLAHILEDFPLLDRFQPVLPREQRSTVTRDLLLLRYATALGHMDPNCDDLGVVALGGPRRLDERVDQAIEFGAVPYVPGELGRAVSTQPVTETA